MRLSTEQQEAINRRAILNTIEGYLAALSDTEGSTEVTFAIEQNGGTYTLEISADGESAHTYLAGFDEV